MLREAKAWQALKHIYVLPLLGFKVYGAHPCLISPWCPEGDLEAYMEGKLELEFGGRLKIVSLHLFSLSRERKVNASHCIHLDCPGRPWFTLHPRKANYARRYQTQECLDVPRATSD